MKCESLLKRVVSSIVTVVSLCVLATAHAQTPRSKVSRTTLGTAPATTKGFPNISGDFLAALDTLGIRPGMTLREADAAARRYGASVPAPKKENTDYQFTRDMPYDGIHLEVFSHSSEALPEFRGHALQLIADPPGPNGPGYVLILAFPRDPLGNVYDPDNQIIYRLETQIGRSGAQGRNEGLMSEAQFLSDAARRAGRVSRSKGSDRAQCSFAEEYARQVTARAGLLQSKPNPNLALYKSCGEQVIVQPSLDAAGKVFAYKVVRTDANLAERAYNAFRVYGSKLREAILRQQGGSN
ncbi:MAG: hypothetical protein R3E77_00620 [Steroidobacteraceae bacterium]